jgi:hypothetical protein
MGSGNAYTVDPPALVAASGAFTTRVPAVAARVGTLAAANAADTGNAPLNALIARLTGQVIVSVGGMGMALQDDASGLVDNASTYVAGDQSSVPGFTPGGG